MADLAAEGKVKEASISAVVVRADGSREQLGVVSFWHRSPWRRLLWRLSAHR